MKDIYASNLLQIKNSLQKSQEELSAPGILSLAGEGFPVTKGILFRMWAYYSLQWEIKSTYRKRVASDGADFFTDTVLSYVSAAIRGNGSDLVVASEEKLHKKRGKLRPDISFWKNGVPVAVIECKTQMGWSRKNWEQAFNSREEALKNEFPSIQVFHVVMTDVNWPGLPPGHPNTGKKWVTLTKGWPKESCEILNPIEPILHQILKL